MTDYGVRSSHKVRAPGLWSRLSAPAALLVMIALTVWIGYYDVARAGPHLGTVAIAAAVLEAAMLGAAAVIFLLFRIGRILLGNQASVGREDGLPPRRVVDRLLPVAYIFMVFVQMVSQILTPTPIPWPTDPLAILRHSWSDVWFTGACALLVALVGLWFQYRDTRQRREAHNRPTPLSFGDA